MSTERRSHECGACGGSGEVNACGPDHGLNTCERHNCCDCEQSFDDVRLNGFDCLVCLGSGRIPEPTEAELRLDAYADAVFRGEVALVSGLARQKVSRVTGKPTGLKVFDEKEVKQMQFWEATIIACEGMIIFAKRYADLARAMAVGEADRTRKAELTRIADALGQCLEPVRFTPTCVGNTFVCL